MKEITTNGQPMIRVYLLGQYRLVRRKGNTWQAVSDPAWQQRRVRNLLGCLLSSPGRMLGREQVMETLWPDLDIDTAANRLNSAVHRLRQVLEPTLARPAASRLLRLEHDVFILADQQELWVDADAFENLLYHAHRTSNSQQAERLLEQAATLYAGEFLPEERTILWATPRRETLKRAWMGLLLELADLYLTRNTLSSAMEVLERLLSVDPTNEAAVRRLMILLTRMDRRAEALRSYHHLIALLQKQYGAEPLPETRELYATLRHGSQPVISPARTTRTPNPSQASPENRPLRPILHIGRSNQSQLIGRDQEYEAMCQIMLTLQQGPNARISRHEDKARQYEQQLSMPHLLLLMGDAGIGKTRLAEELSRQANEQGWSVVWSRIYEQEGTLPYRPWIEILRKFISNGHLPLDNAKFGKITLNHLCGLLPELHTMVSVSSQPLSPEQEQLHLREAMLKCLITMSAKIPLLIVFDDLQWADSSSIELLAYLIRRLRGQPILLLGTCRDTELPASFRSLVADLQHERVALTFSLQPLTAAQIGALVAHLPEAIVRRIQMQSAGNPFFAEELARSVSAQATMSEEKTAHTAPVNPLPETITAAINRRISKLSWACQQLLGKAVVLGASFEFNQLRLMNIGTSEDTLLDLLEEALAAGVLIEEGVGAHVIYDFWHPLIVSHLYERLSAAKRAYLHRQAAEALRQVYQGREEEGAATITHHLLKGGGAPLQIAHFAQLAGDHDYALSAYPEAQRHYQLAITQIEATPKQLLISAQGERLRLAYLFERVGACMTVQGDYEQARHLYERVLALRAYPHPDVSSAKHQQEVLVQALLWYLIGRLWNYTASYDKVRECCEHGMKILLDAGITSGPVMACLYLQQGNQYLLEGNYDEARRVINEALQMSEKALRQKVHLIDDPSLSVDIRRTIEGNPLEVGRAHELLGIIAVQTGQLAEGLPHIHMALEIFEQHDFVLPMASVSANLGVIYVTKAEYAEARVCFTRAFELAERVGDVRMMSINSRNLGEVAFLVGDLTEAIKYHQQSVDLLERLNARDQLIWSLLTLALALHDQGKLHEAWRTALRGLWLSRIIKSAPAVSACLIVLAAIRLTVLEREQREGRGVERILIKRLQRTEVTVRRALATDGLNGDDMITGRVVLARVLLMRGKLDEAEKNVLHMLEEMFLQQNNNMLTQVQRLLGCLLIAQGREEEAEVYFQQALQTAREYTMRLEYARALYDYGNALLKRSIPRDVTYRQGMRYLQEAHDIFVACDAVIDLEKVKQTLEPMDFDNQAQ